MTKLEELAHFSQSVWLDNINRKLFATGRLKELIDQGLLGMTSNPTIFENAITKSDDYDEEILSLAKAGKSTFEIYDELTVKDIQKAADLFHPVYERTKGLDGYVSLEINPMLADKTKETIDEGKRLHGKVQRPNLMLKVPSTDEGFEAVEALTSLGMNVNVTLIFSRAQYRNTVEAYMKGIRKFIKSGGDAGKVRSVASVFVSRVDTLADTMLAEKIYAEESQDMKDQIESMKGKAAVANSLAIYRIHRELFSSPQFLELKAEGAHHQRPLWASTGTKNAAYSDIKYVEELLVRNTVNTLPEATLTAFMDHGRISDVEKNCEESENTLLRFAEKGIDIDKVCQKLLTDGVASFKKSFESLLASIETKARKLHV